MLPAKKPELLAPGGNLQKALTALRFGADAVYVGGTAFGLRAAAGNFTDAEMRELLTSAHAQGKKVYVTLNILPSSREIAPLCRYAETLRDMGVDGAIVADLGAFLALRREVPGLPLHVSTQANNLNADTCLFWA
ncbi:MAG: U32 family peptidase, partial [Clostridia bacterium]|nr:U32 family peptidase [Clostridia bacterium]